MSMEGNVALVTGGSRGIGRAICLELARQGAAVAVNYAGSSQAAEETAEQCRALGVEAEVFQADVSDPAACSALVAAVKERFGRLDILVNNAGISRDGLLMTAKEEDFTQTLDTNLKGAYFCTKAAAKVMLRQKYGRIICLSSGATRVRPPTPPARPEFWGWSKRRQRSWPGGTSPSTRWLPAILRPI